MIGSYKEMGAPPLERAIITGTIQEQRLQDLNLRQLVTRYSRIAQMIYKEEWQELTACSPLGLPRACQVIGAIRSLLEHVSTTAYSQIIYAGSMTTLEENTKYAHLINWMAFDIQKRIIALLGINYVCDSSMSVPVIRLFDGTALLGTYGIVGALGWSRSHGTIYLLYAIDTQLSEWQHTIVSAIYANRQVLWDARNYFDRVPADTKLFALAQRVWVLDHFAELQQGNPDIMQSLGLSRFPISAAYLRLLDKAAQYGNTVGNYCYRIHHQRCMPTAQTELNRGSSHISQESLTTTINSQLLMNKIEVIKRRGAAMSKQLLTSLRTNPKAFAAGVEVDMNSAR